MGEEECGQTCLVPIGSTLPYFITQAFSKNVYKTTQGGKHIHLFVTSIQDIELAFSSGSFFFKIRLREASGIFFTYFLHAILLDQDLWSMLFLFIFSFSLSVFLPVLSLVQSPCLRCLLPSPPLPPRHLSLLSPYSGLASRVHRDELRGFNCWTWACVAVAVSGR